MWGSFLDQIHKKLDDVSGLAEQVIGGDYDDEEEEEEEEEEEKKYHGYMDMTLKAMGLKQADTAMANGNGTDETNLSTHINEIVVEELKPHVHESTALAATTAHSASKEESSHSVTMALEDTGKEPIPLEQSPSRSVKTSSASPARKEEEEKESAAATVTLETSPSISQPTAAAPEPNDAVSHHMVKGGGNEEQLLRFQQLLADEMEVSRLLREEKRNLDHRIGTLEKELSSLRHFKKNASQTDPEKLELLEREGLELSRKLGKERERFKLLYEKKEEVDSRVEALEKKVAQSEVNEKELQQMLAASNKDCEAANQRVEELAGLLTEKVNKVRQLQQQLKSAKQTHAEVVAQHEKELSQQKSELNYQKENASDTVVSLQREKDVLVSSLQRNQMEYEQRIQELEHKLVLAHRRTSQAEMRLTDHERSALAPLRELRAALDDVERQKKKLMEEVEYWKGECSAMQRSRESEKKHFTQRLADMQSEMQVVQNERLAVEQELQQSRGKHSQVQKALDKALERASHAEATKEQLAAALEEARRRVDSANNSVNNSMNNTMTPNAGMGETPRHALSSLDVTPSGVRLPLFPMDAAESVSDVRRGSRSRVERELVRQAVEIERLRRVEEEAAETKQKLTLLASQHDLLMQMYGQVQEELQKSQLEQSSK